MDLFLDGNWIKFELKSLNLLHYVGIPRSNAMTIDNKAARFTDERSNTLENYVSEKSTTFHI